MVFSEVTLVVFEVCFERLDPVLDCPISLRRFFDALDCLSDGVNGFEVLTFGILNDILSSDLEEHLMQ